MNDKDILDRVNELDVSRRKILAKVRSYPKRRAAVEKKMGAEKKELKAQAHAMSVEAHELKQTLSVESPIVLKKTVSDRALVKYMEQVLLINVNKIRKEFISQVPFNNEECHVVDLCDMRVEVQRGKITDILPSK